MIAVPDPVGLDGAPGVPVPAAAADRGGQPDPAVLQQLALDWAVVPLVIDDAESIEELWQRTVDARDQRQRAGAARARGWCCPAAPG